MATNRGARARAQRVDRAREQRDRQTGRDKDEKTPERDRDRPGAERQGSRVEVRGRTWDDETDRDTDYRDDGDNRFYGLTRKKRDAERIAGAWTHASARLFAGTTDVLANLVENLSDTFLNYRGDDDDRGRHRSRPGSRRGGRDRYDNDDDYDRSPHRGRRSRYSNVADRADDFAGDLSAAVRDAARVFTRAAESFSRVYEDRDDGPRGRRRVYRDDEHDDDSGRKGEDADRGGRLTVEAGPKHFAVEAESKGRGEGKHSSAGEETRDSEEESS